MVLVSKRNLLVVAGVTVFTLLFLGIIGYRFFLHPEMAEGLGDKLTAERFLFISILVATLMLILYGALLLRSQNVSREIERMTRLTGSDDYRPEVSLRKMGSFGSLLASLFTRISEMNRKLSLHIGGQSSLLTFLTGNMNQPVLVTDILGKILYVSKGYVEKKEAVRAELLEQYVENLSADIVTQNILAQTSESHSPVNIHLEKEKEDVAVHPVYNRDAVVAYLVFVFRKDTVFIREALVPEEGAGKGKDGKGKTPRRGDNLFGGIASFFQGGSSGKKS